VPPAIVAITGPGLAVGVAFGTRSGGSTGVGPVAVAVGCRYGFHDGDGADRPLLSGTASQMRDDVKRYEDVGIEELHLITAQPNLVVSEVVDAWKRFDDEVIDRL
jgi:hypothetical protein